jgi:uncharacterized damage-inducible protein DinB
MNYYGAKDLASAFRTVRDNTIRIAEDVGEENYGFRATPENRSIAETLIHIVNIPKSAYEIHAVRKLTALADFDFRGLFQTLTAAEKTPHSKAEIVRMLTEGRDKIAGWLDTLSDSFLGESVAMFPGATPLSKTRFEMLLGIKEHEMHHRAQLMLMERMIGIVPHLTRQMQERMARMQTQSQEAGKR